MELPAEWVNGIQHFLYFEGFEGENIEAFEQSGIKKLYHDYEVNGKKITAHLGLAPGSQMSIEMIAVKGEQSKMVELMSGEITKKLLGKEFRSAHGFNTYSSAGSDIAFFKEADGCFFVMAKNEQSHIDRQYTAPMNVRFTVARVPYENCKIIMDSLFQKASEIVDFLANIKAGNEAVSKIVKAYKGSKKLRTAFATSMCMGCCRLIKP